MGASGTTDFDRISREARERLVAEVQRTVSEVSAAVDDAVEDAMEAAEYDARRHHAVGRVRDLANGLHPLQELSAELAERALELERQVARIATLAADAAEALGFSLTAEPESDTAVMARAEPENASSDPPELAPESPLDRLEEHRREIAEAPLDFPPRRSLPDDPAARPVDIPPAVLVIVDQLRMAGERDYAILRRLEQMGVDDPEAVLAQVRETP